VRAVVSNVFGKLVVKADFGPHPALSQRERVPYFNSIAGPTPAVYPQFLWKTSVTIPSNPRRPQVKEIGQKSANRSCRRRPLRPGWQAMIVEGCGEKEKGVRSFFVLFLSGLNKD
jgi:hypothetical protein